MAGALYLPGADRTSRWFFDDYPNAAMPRIDKTLLHSTETQKSSGCPGYAGGSTAPQVTINPWKGYRKTWQHFPNNRPGRALGNPSSTPVSENKDNVWQVEIIGFSDPVLGRKYGCYLPELDDAGLDYLAEQIAFLHKEWPHPLTLPPSWPLYKVSTYTQMQAAHMTSSQYDAFAGILAHLHAPKPSSHGDVAINIKALVRKINVILTGGPVADPINPVWRGTAAQQAQNKSWWSSDIIDAPDGSTTNPYWSLGSYYNKTLEWNRRTVLAVERMEKQIKALSDAVEKITPPA
jgi:hypothetical protein